MIADNELIIDSFAGGGGASLGISWALGRGPDIAINHDKEAIAMHKENHPESRHYAEDVWAVDPVVACAGRPVGLMWLSPDCKHFSKAKGGKPVSPRVRGLAKVALVWAKAVRPRVIVLENVEEFQTWGPVLAETGRPCPIRKGRTFRAFIKRFKQLGYAIDWKELRACDYGTPTIRRRLFLVARCDGAPICWPAATHGKGRAQAWRTAAECIDWSIPCPSIFERKRPLVENTMKRVARGIRRFVIESPRPFIVNLVHGTIAPVIAGVGGRAGQSPERPVTQPYQTITAKGDAALVAPLLIPLTHHDKFRGQSPEEPMKTITAAHRGETALIAPMLVPRYGEREGQEPRVRRIDEPAATIVPTGNGGALCAAFITKHFGERPNGGRLASGADEPLPTITARGTQLNITTAYLEVMHGTASGRSVDAPAPTILAGGWHLAEVRAFLVAYYGNDKDGADLFDPMRTLSTHDRFGLVTVEGQDYVIFDIGMRMLAPRELYRAQGFPDSYRIEITFNGKPLGKTAQVRMCGNSVCPPLAEAIIRANLSGGVGVAEVAA